MKAHVLANQWPWALEMSLLTLQHVFNLSSLLTIITRLLERIRQFWQNLSSQLTTWRPGQFCKIKASFADDFRARPIVNEEEGFVAEKSNVLLYCCCFFGRETQTIVKQRWNLLTFCMRALFLETIKALYFFIPVTEVSSLKSHANKLK